MSNDDLSSSIVVSARSRQCGDSSPQVKVECSPSGSNVLVHSGPGKSSVVATTGSERTLSEGQEDEGSTSEYEQLSDVLVAKNRKLSSYQIRTRGYRRDQLGRLDRIRHSVRALGNRIESSTKYLPSVLARFLLEKDMLSINGVLTFAEEELFGQACGEENDPSEFWTAELRKNAVFGAYLERRTGDPAADIPGLVKRLRARPVAEELEMDSLMTALVGNPGLLILSDLLSKEEARLLFGICQYLYIPSIIGFRRGEWGEIQVNSAWEYGMVPFEGAEDDLSAESASELGVGPSPAALDRAMQGVSNWSNVDVKVQSELKSLFAQERDGWIQAVSAASKALNRAQHRQSSLRWKIAKAFTGALLLKGPLNAAVVMDKYLHRAMIGVRGKYEKLDGSHQKTWEKCFLQDPLASKSILGDYRHCEKLAEIAVSIYLDALQSNRDEPCGLSEKEGRAFVIYLANPKMDGKSVKMLEYMCMQMNILCETVGKAEA